MAPRSADFWKEYLKAKQIVRAAEMETDLLREEFEDRDQSQPDVLYEPTATSNPNRPRTVAARYWRDEKVMRVSWRDGGVDYNYYEVSPADWRRFVNSKSPGKLINRYFNGKPYGPAEDQ